MLFLQGDKHKLTDLAFSHDGNRLAVPVWKKGVQVWHAPFGHGTVTLIPDKEGATKAEFAAAGRVLVQGNHGWFLLHDPGTGITTKLEAESDTGYPYYGGVSPDGRHLVAAFSSRTPGGGSWFFCREMAAPGENLWKLLSKRAALGMSVFVSGGRAVTFEFSGTGTSCVLRDLKTGTVQTERGGLARQPKCTAASTDGSLWAVTEGRTVSVYSAAEFGAPVARLTSTAKTEFTGHAFHPSGRHLLVCSVDQSVKVYDTATWQLVRTYDWGQGKLFSMAVTPDGTLAAVGGDKGQIVVWDWE
jgi:WD40 repeat protein